MKITPNTLFLNGGIALVGVLSIGLIVRSYLATEEVMSCADRYAQGVLYALERRPGELASGGDLQARMGGRDWGVIENVNAVAVGEGDIRHALEVRIPKGAHGSAGTGVKSGMSFPWTPRSMKRAASACLGYRVWFGPGFEFQHGGRLPSLVGGVTASEERSKSALSARMVWGPGGKGDLLVIAGSGINATNVAVERGIVTFEAGRWAAIELEVVLNAPGARDGMLRVWIDGVLKADRRNLVYRDTADVALDAVSADVISGSAEPSTAARRDLRVRLTPFELRWN